MRCSACAVRAADRRCAKPRADRTGPCDRAGRPGVCRISGTDWWGANRHEMAAEVAVPAVPVARWRVCQRLSKVPCPACVRECGWCIRGTGVRQFWGLLAVYRRMVRNHYHAAYGMVCAREGRRRQPRFGRGRCCGRPAGLRGSGKQHPYPA